MKRIFLKIWVNFHYKCPNPFKLFIFMVKCLLPRSHIDFLPASLWIQMNAKGKCAPFLAEILLFTSSIPTQSMFVIE